MNRRDELYDEYQEMQYNVVLLEEAGRSRHPRR
jgi:hypothetical protein